MHRRRWQSMLRTNRRRRSFSIIICSLWNDALAIQCHLTDTPNVFDNAHSDVLCLHFTSKGEDTDASHVGRQLNTRTLFWSNLNIKPTRIHFLADADVGTPATTTLV